MDDVSSDCLELRGWSVLKKFRTAQRGNFDLDYFFPSTMVNIFVR